MYIVLLLSLILIFLYFSLIRDFGKAWEREPVFSYSPADASRPLSLLIPFKNERHRIAGLLDSLGHLDRSKNPYEVIFIDDHSTDGTAELIRDMVSGNAEVRILSAEGEPGKKNALHRGVLASKFDWIVTSDADCKLPPFIMQAYSAFIASQESLLISGPVRMNAINSGIFQKFQEIEFMSLNGTGGAAILAGMPLMCNGANLCFHKSLFLEAFPFIHPGFRGGDDMFLMEYALKNYPKKISFLKCTEAIIETIPEQNWFSFLRQRSRWTSKAPLYRNHDLLRVAALVLLMNLWFFILLTAGLLNLSILLVLAGWWAIKTLIDYRFLRRIGVFYGQDVVFKLCGLFQIVYPFYIVLSSFGGLVSYTKHK